MGVAVANGVEVGAGTEVAVGGMGAVLVTLTEVEVGVWIGGTDVEIPGSVGVNVDKVVDSGAFATPVETTAVVADDVASNICGSGVDSGELAAGTMKTSTAAISATTADALASRCNLSLLIHLSARKRPKAIRPRITANTNDPIMHPFVSIVLPL